MSQNYEDRPWGKKNSKNGTGEMGKWIKAFVTRHDNLNPVPRTSDFHTWYTHIPVHRYTKINSF